MVKYRVKSACYICISSLYIREKDGEKGGAFHIREDAIAKIEELQTRIPMAGNETRTVLSYNNRSAQQHVTVATRSGTANI